MNYEEEYNRHRNDVIRKETSLPGVYVLKYKRHVFFEGTWDPFLRECRGLIVDKDNNLVQYPFTKIHNFRKEADAPEWEDDVEVDVVRKVNGFMVAIGNHNGKLLVSTTGSIDSDFVTLARSHVSWELENFILRTDGSYTFMFECCDPSDPHIVDEEPGLYFLGLRENKFGSEICYNPNHAVWNSLGVKTIPVEYMTVGEVKEALKTCRHEGYVMYRENGEVQEASKWKSPYYLIKKLFMRGNIDKLMAKNIKQTIDEEYYPLLSHIKTHRESFTEMSERDRKSFIENFLMSEQ
jgi:hypothetical protein